MGEVGACCSTKAIVYDSKDGLTSEFYIRQMTDERKSVIHVGVNKYTSLGGRKSKIGTVIFNSYIINMVGL
jgi:hypothetical protein